MEKTPPYSLLWSFQTLKTMKTPSSIHSFNLINVNVKICLQCSIQPTPFADIYRLTHLIPTPIFSLCFSPKGSKIIKKGLKKPQKSQNSSQRSQKAHKGSKRPKTGLQTLKGLKSPKRIYEIRKKGLKPQVGPKTLTRG